MKLARYKRRQNNMSYMVTVKGQRGIVIASDSYSTYYTRKLKDDNYTKIHEIIPHQFYIGATGLNVLYDRDNSYIDIQKIIHQFFDNITREQLKDKIQEFADYLQDSCDCFGVDASCIYIYNQEMYVTDIIHQLGNHTNYWSQNEFDIIFMGEDYAKSIGRKHFTQRDMFSSLDEIEKKCQNSIKTLIKFENEHFEEGQRAIGGNVQIHSIPFKNEMA